MRAASSAWARRICGADTDFTDTISNPVSVGSDGTTQGGQEYQFSAQGIAWPGEAKKYTSKPDYNLSEVVPPPNWSSYNGTYTSFPDLASDERFQNWMRTAGLPTFSKLYGRNDDADLLKGTYEITITDSRHYSRHVRRGN